MGARSRARGLDADRAPAGSGRWLVTRCPRLAGVGGEISGTDGGKYWRSCRTDVDACKLANLGKTEKIGHHRLAATIFIGAVGMQSVTAASGVGIDQPPGKIIAAEKPGENVG